MSRFIIDVSPEADYIFDEHAIARKYNIILGDVVACYRGVRGVNKNARFIYYRQIENILVLHSKHNAVTFGLDVTAKYPNVKLQFAKLFDHVLINEQFVLRISFLASDEGFAYLNLDKRCYSYDIAMRQNGTSVVVNLVPDSWLRKNDAAKTDLLVSLPKIRWSGISLVTAMRVLNQRVNQFVSDNETCLCFVNTNANGFNSIAFQCVAFYSDTTITVHVGEKTETLTCTKTAWAYLFMMKPKDVERFRQSVVDVCGSGLLAFYRCGPKRRLFVLPKHAPLFYPTEHDMSELSPCMMHPQIVELAIIFANLFTVYELLFILEQIPTLNFVPRHVQSKIITGIFDSIRKIKSQRLS